MKKYLLLFLMTSSICFSQKKINFKKGVEILKLNKKQNYQTPKSILFEFKGNTHLIHHFLGLSKKIKKRFKRKGIKVNFNYNLSALKPWKDDLKYIPSIKYNSNEYEAICFLNVKNFKIFKKNIEGFFIRHVPENSQFQISHELDVTLKDKRINLLTLSLRVYSYATISTENKMISKILRNVIIN